LIVMLILLAFPLVVHGQVGEVIKFSHLTVGDGLPSNNVAAVLQDSQGFIWIGTNDAGVSKFDGIKFKNYSNIPNDPDSLANNCAWRLYQDKKGNIWIATWGGGVSRYDPARDVFITYSHDTNDAKSLTSNLVWSVLVDSNDDLWVGTDDGLNKYDPEKKAFIHFRNIPDDSTSISSNSVTMVLEASDGFLWVSTYGGGLNKYDPAKKTFTRYSHDDKDPRSLCNDFIHFMHRDKDGTLWLGTEGGIDKLDPKTETFTHYQHNENDPHSLSGTPVASIFRDSKERLWVATDDHGINLFDPQTNTFQRFQHDRDDLDSLADNTVWSIHEGTNGTLWFTTFNGLDSYDAAGSGFKYYQHHPGDPSGLSENSVQSFARDNEGMLWIGTRGGGLNQFDPVKKTFTHYLHKPDNPDSLSNDTIHVIVKARDGVLWIGTGSGVDRFDPQKKTFTHYQPKSDNPNSLSHGSVRDIDIAQDGSLWIGMQGGGLDRFDPVSQTFTHFKPEKGNPNSLVSEWVFAVFIDSFGKVWVGTEGGLSCLDPKTRIFTNYISGKMDFNTRAIYQDQLGTIWVGTNGGLHRFNQESKTFTRYNSNDGLAGDMVASIIADNQDSLWVGTNKGLSKFDPKKKKFRNYDVRDGLQGNQFRRDAVYKSPEGELYFGGINGFNSFFPEKVIDNPHIPPVVLSDFRLFNHPVGIGGDSPLQQHISVAKQITLSYDQNVFSIEFAALNYRNSAKNQYMYMMEGFDKEFIQAGSGNNHATYTNLDPGRYTFRVKGSNNDGLWNEQGASIEILILPPWWETSWFYSVMALFGLIIVFAVMFYFVKLHKEIADRKQAEGKLKESDRRSCAWLEHSPVCVKILDLDFNLQFMSRAGIKALKFDDVTEYYGKHFPLDFYPDSFKETMDRNLKKVRDNGVVIEQEGAIVDIYGEEMWFHATMVPVYDEQGQLDYILVVSTNTTERKRAELQLKASNQQLIANELQREELVKTLEYKNKELRDIVYSTSHDLKSPLVNIAGFSGVLHSDCDRLLEMLTGQDGSEGKRQEIDTLLKENIPESLSFISGSAKKMASLLDGLLQISKVGAIEIKSEPINMNKTMGEVIAAMGHQIKENNVTVTVETLSDCVADPNMLDHVFSNLIGNAIKYRDPAKESEIRLSGKIEDGMSTYCVEDNGVGIATDYQNKVFEIFHRLNPNEDIEGEGLGLTIVTRIMDRLGGKVWVESEPGKGSQFFIALPTVS
jgi:PAS domain S-box-containing protein